MYVQHEENLNKLGCVFSTSCPYAPYMLSGPLNESSLAGLCPQHDVLFDRLTVEEHLWFFAKLKNCPTHRVKQEVDGMIECIGLTDKRHTQTRALSGGMKRKLSIGLALISDSKVNSCVINVNENIAKSGRFKDNSVLGKIKATSTDN